MVNNVHYEKVMLKCIIWHSNQTYLLMRTFFLSISESSFIDRNVELLDQLLIGLLKFVFFDYKFVIYRL